MNTLNFNQSVGFPLETNILDEMQTSYSLFNALGAIAGNFSIISGCVLSGSTVADGVVFINGEVLEFKGGIAQAHVIIVETKVALEFEDANSHDVIFRRHATFGTATTQYPWADFKRSFETKNIIEELDKKVPNTELVALNARLLELEKKSAVFQTGGGMVLWNKPVNLIPNGWAEVVDWRGRMPVGLDVSQTEFNTIGKTGGNKSKTLSDNEIPKIHARGSSADIGDPGLLIITAGSQENAGIDLNPGGGQAFSILNPYRTVLFIEYIG